MKIWKALSLLVVIMPLIVACSSAKDAKSKADEAHFACKVGGEVAPKWVCGNTPFEGSITEVGVGSSRAGAMANGRENLSQMITVVIKSKVKEFSMMTGTEPIIKDVFKQNKKDAKEILKSALQTNSWNSEKTKETYVQVGVAKSLIDDVVKKYFKPTPKATTKKSDADLWKEFQAKKSNDALSKALK